MRRAFAACALAVAMVIVAQPAGASTTLSFDAHFRETFGRSSAPSGTGFISGFGDATEVFTATHDTLLDNGCTALDGTTVITLLSDGSTLTIKETDVICTPGVSTGTRGSLVSFGNPFTFTGPWTIVKGTGIFKGAKGGGTVSGSSGGDALIIAYEGTITLK